LPHLQALFENYGDQGLKVVAVNVIPGQDGMLPQWVEEGGYTFPVLRGADTAEISAEYRMTTAPLTFLLDAEGKILERFEGYQPGREQDIETAVRHALGLAAEQRKAVG